VQPPFCYKVTVSCCTQSSVAEASVTAGGEVLGEQRAIRGEDGQTTRGMDPPGRPVKDLRTMSVVLHFISSLPKLESSNSVFSLGSACGRQSSTNSHCLFHDWR